MLRVIPIQPHALEVEVGGEALCAPYDSHKKYLLKLMIKLTWCVEHNNLPPFFIVCLKKLLHSDWLRTVNIVLIFIFTTAQRVSSKT